MYKCVHHLIERNITFWMVPHSLYRKDIIEVVLKNITYFVFIFYAFRQLHLQNPLDKNGFKPLCDQYFHTYTRANYLIMIHFVRMFCMKIVLIDNSLITLVRTFGVPRYAYGYWTEITRHCTTSVIFCKVYLSRVKSHQQFISLVYIVFDYMRPALHLRWVRD